MSLQPHKEERYVDAHHYGILKQIYDGLLVIAPSFYSPIDILVDAYGNAITSVQHLSLFYYWSSFSF